MIFKDGDVIKKGDKIADIEGSARYILMGERTALNYVQRMSGIATETNKYHPCTFLQISYYLINNGLIH